MSVNLLETVQQNLGYPALQKIDPNTFKVSEETETPVEDKFSQAAIPAVLTALCEFAQTDAGVADILQGNEGRTWMNKIFADNKEDTLRTIAAFAKQPNEDPIEKMNAIAIEAVKIIKENLPADASIKDVKAFLSDQKNNILLYLPAELNIGEMLLDDSLDDSTHKMEGPVSSLIKNIGDSFSGSVTGEEKNKIKTDKEKTLEENY
jgi:hypothetical protein